MRGEPDLKPLRNKAGKVVSPYWYIYYYDGKRSRRVSTRYRIGAQDHEAKIALSQFILERERPKSKEPSQLMIAQALKDYNKEHVQFTARKEQAKYVEARLNQKLSHFFASDITQSRINEYVRFWQEKGYSNGTILIDLGYLQAALNHEVREQRLLYAPKFKKPEQPEPKGRVLTPKETASLLAACESQHVKDFIGLMLETGQRPGAVENLTWFQVDFNSREINFDKTGRRITNKRVRPVAMSNEAYRILKRLHKVKQTEYVLEFEDFISGQIRHAGCVRKAFERACKRAGLDDVSRYTLRHTVMDDLDSLGTDEKTTSSIAGHTNTKTTRHHYIKTKMKRQRKALNAASKLRKRRTRK